MQSGKDQVVQHDFVYPVTDVVYGSYECNRNPAFCIPGLSARSGTAAPTAFCRTGFPAEDNTSLFFGDIQHQNNRRSGARNIINIINYRPQREKICALNYSTTINELQNRKTVTEIVKFNMNAVSHFLNPRHYFLSMLLSIKGSINNVFFLCLYILNAYKFGYYLYHKTDTHIDCCVHRSTALFAVIA